MKSLVVLALIAGSAAHADLARNLKGAAKAAEGAAAGGKAAVGAAKAVKSSLPLTAVAAAIHVRFTPGPEKLEAFRAKISETVKDASVVAGLVDAYKTQVLTAGCAGAKLTEEALNNLYKVARGITEENLKAGTTVTGLAAVAAANGDLENTGVKTPEGVRISQEADATLNAQAVTFVVTYQNTILVNNTKKSDEEAIASVENLGSCGVNTAITARAKQAMAARSRAAGR